MCVDFFNVSNDLAMRLNTLFQINYKFRTIIGGSLTFKDVLSCMRKLLH